LGEFDRATQAFGLATSLGVMSTTGIAGLTLGGGLGWLNGRDGLACDNLISADVATADGQVLRASPEENDDLFWGIRGGGGNFGIVTSFEYQLHPVDLVLAGRRFHEVEMPPR
jgi:FAD/FMN-containing dehydrogenase